MSIPSTIITKLNRGQRVAAQVFTPEADMRAYVEIIPLVPSPHEHPEAWNYWEDRFRPFAFAPTLRSPDLISGYEIRSLKHHEKYTKTDWGYDYDHVLNDRSTRVKRVFVDTTDEIEKALSPWLTDLTALRDCLEFDSSLVSNRLGYYLDRPDERPHLWLE